MNFLEKDLETIIFETPNEKLTERGLCIEGRKTRQLRIGNYGISDVVCFKKTLDIEQFHDNGGNLITLSHRMLQINVLELKQNKIDCNTLMQAARYCAGIKSYLNDFRETSLVLEFKITLIGNDIQTNGDFAYLIEDELFPNIEIFTYKYDFDGIKFMRQHGGYKLTNEGFSSNKNPF